MLLPLPPAEAYRRVELDALIAGGDARQLTRLCLAEAIGALNRAVLWHERSDRARRSASLGRALCCVQALRMGVDGAHPLADALLVVYADASAKIARAMVRFDRAVVAAVRRDFLDMEEAFAAA